MSTIIHVFMFAELPMEAILDSVNYATYKMFIDDITVSGLSKKTTIDIKIIYLLRSYQRLYFYLELDVLYYVCTLELPDGHHIAVDFDNARSYFDQHLMLVWILVTRHFSLGCLLGSPSDVPQGRCYQRLLLRSILRVSSFTMFTPMNPRLQMVTRELLL